MKSIIQSIREATEGYAPFGSTLDDDATVKESEQFYDARDDHGQDAARRLEKILAALAAQETQDLRNATQRDLNDLAVARAKVTIDEYRDRWDVAEDDETPLRDLLADLMHLDADRPDPDLQAAYLTASNRFAEEAELARWEAAHPGESAQ